MSHLNAAPPGHLPAGSTADVDTLVRTLLLSAVFLLLWISLRPFGSLAEVREVTEAGNLVNQVGYSLLFVLLAAWCAAHQPRRLLLLLRPILIVTLTWCAFCVAISWEPQLSARRFAFTLIVISIAAMVLLVPKNVRQFSDVLTAVVMIVLALCYFGIVFAPSVSIHQATDYIEPELAGDWRGVFGHKNEASLVMVLFIFIGLFVSRVRGAGLGGLIVVLSLVFLLFTRSKSAIGMLPVVLFVSFVMARTRRPRVGIALSLSILALLSIFTVGSVFFEPVRNVVDKILPDPTFTGRTEIWPFVAERIEQRPLTGYGFAAFWRTPEVVYGMGGGEVWANSASHAHNGYLDLALTIGIPGSVLVTLWLVVLPMIDFYRSPREQSVVPLKMLFLRVCIFAAYGACLESTLLPEGANGLFLFAAAFGLRFISMTRVMA